MVMARGKRDKRGNRPLPTAQNIRDKQDSVPDMGSIIAGYVSERTMQASAR